jgi:hypothetical protein
MRIVQALTLHRPHDSGRIVRNSSSCIDVSSRFGRSTTKALSVALYSPIGAPCVSVSTLYLLSLLLLPSCGRSPYLVLDLPSGRLFDIFVSEAFKRILLSLKHIYPYYYFVPLPDLFCRVPTF